MERQLSDVEKEIAVKYMQKVQQTQQAFQQAAEVYNDLLKLLGNGDSTGTKIDFHRGMLITVNSDNISQPQQ